MEIHSYKRMNTPDYLCVPDCILAIVNSYYPGTLTYDDIINVTGIKLPADFDSNNLILLELIM